MRKKSGSAAGGSSKTTDANLKVSKQAAGGVTGAVLGAMVAGPAGAIAGGIAGTMVGDSSARGKKPVKRAVDTVRAEISKGRALKALKSVAGTIKKSTRRANSGSKSAA